MYVSTCSCIPKFIYTIRNKSFFCLMLLIVCCWDLNDSKPSLAISDSLFLTIFLTKCFLKSSGAAVLGNFHLPLLQLFSFVSLLWAPRSWPLPSPPTGSLRLHSPLALGWVGPTGCGEKEWGTYSPLSLPAWELSGQQLHLSGSQILSWNSVLQFTQGCLW